jgi:hypothetical protein
VQVADLILLHVPFGHAVHTLEAWRLDVPAKQSVQLLDPL